MTCPTRTYYYSSGEIESKKWLVNGLPHKTDGPARIGYYPNGKIEFEQWYLNGESHRTEGPAFTLYKVSGEIKSEFWWLNGLRIHPEDWLEENDYEWPLDQNQQIELLLRFG